MARTTTKAQPAAKRKVAPKKATAAKPAARKAPTMSLRQALLKCITDEPRKAGDVIEEAITLWRKHGGGTNGKTPKATASTQLLMLQRAGAVAKPERGMVQRVTTTEGRATIDAILAGKKVAA